MASCPVDLFVYAYCILGWYGMYHKDIKCLDVSRRCHKCIVMMPSTLYAFSCLNVPRRYQVLMADHSNIHRLLDLTVRKGNK